MFFLPGILSFHQLRSIPWAHQMRLILGFLMERVTQMQTSFGRSGAEHLDLQIKDAEHLVERRTGISICLVLCNVSTHVIYIYIYTYTWSERPKSVLEAWSCLDSNFGPFPLTQTFSHAHSCVSKLLMRRFRSSPKTLPSGPKTLEKVLHGEVKRKQLQVGQFSQFCCSIFAIEGKDHVLIMYTKIWC